MASLSAHLRQTGDHGRLGFHADCPVCRDERLFGTLSSEGVVSRRAQAALATGAMAFSLATSSPVWAQEPDSGQEGTVAPQEPSQGRDGDVPAGSEAPGIDPGGDTALPFDAGAPQGASQDGANDTDGENAPLEAEPEVDPDIRLVPLTEPDATTPSPGDEDAVAPVAPAPPIDETSPPAAGAPEEPAAEQKHPRRGPTKKRTGVSGKPEQHRRHQHEQNARWTPPTVAPRTTAPVQPTVAVAQASPTVEVAAAAGADAAAPSLRPGSRYHVVRPGESLWSIARGLLGPDASMARIAREVTRLWGLNEERIATGDPDLLKIGTRLTLR